MTEDSIDSEIRQSPSEKCVRLEYANEENEENYLVIS